MSANERPFDLNQNERRKKKSGAAVSHAKLAEKLLAAQLRREAVIQ